jgi:DNA-binding LytR/AlgR family response regulator
LTEPQFRRVYRNAIVNANHIRKMSAEQPALAHHSAQRHAVRCVSKRQAHNIREVLRW